MTARKRAQISVSFVGVESAGLDVCTAWRGFSFTPQTAAQNEMLSFQHPPVTRTEEGHFIVILFSFRTGICAQSENQGLLLEITTKTTDSKPKS